MRLARLRLTVYIFWPLRTIVGSNARNAFFLRAGGIVLRVRVGLSQGYTCDKLICNGTECSCSYAKPSFPNGQPDVPMLGTPFPPYWF